MSSDYDIEMTTDDTVELDTIIEQLDNSNSITKVDEGSDYNIDVIETQTEIFDPNSSGEYKLDINGQKLSINVTDTSIISDSAVEQWIATDYDSQADEFIGVLNGYNLSGGSSTETTDQYGNTVREFSGSSGQEYTNSNVSVSYDRVSIIMVINANSTSKMAPWGDDTNEDVYGRFGNGTSLARFGQYQNVNSSYTNTSLSLFLFDGQLDNNGTPQNVLEVDGSVISTATIGQTGFDGFMLGNYANGGEPFSGYFYEGLVLQNATDQELSVEKTRLKNKYDGLSF